MSKESSPLTKSIKRAVVAVAGVRTVTRATAIKLRVLPPRVARPERLWTQPLNGDGVGTISTDDGAVRVVAPRGELERGTGKYPPVVPGPHVPRIKAGLPRS